MIIDGKQVALKISDKIKKEINSLNEKLTLCVIEIGKNEASKVYINQKEKKCNELGINFKLVKFNEDELESNIEKEIIKLNNDSNITGIIIQLPIPNKYNVNRLINLINPNKDVDGLTNENKIKLLNKDNGLIPCTPLGIVELLKEYNIDVKGKNVVIVGRSELVTKPLSIMLLNMDATITICHSKTKDLKSFTKNADILITATGKSYLIKKDMLKDNSIIIDVGISRINNKLRGDVDFDNVKDKVKYITPVPGGVGPMTVIMLMNNVLEAYKKQKN